MHNYTIETQRLLLRPLTTEDAQDVFEWVSDEQVARYMVYNTYENMEQVFDWLAFIQKEPQANREYHFGYVRKKDGKLIGSGSIGPDSLKEDFWGFGYNFRRDCWDMGYATEAARAMLQFAHDTLGATKFSASHVDVNQASGHVMEKCGLTFEKYGTCQKLDGSCKTRSMEYIGDWSGFLQTRISCMEQYMDDLADALSTNPDALKTNITLRRNARELTYYMESGLWLQDYACDERGELPANLKRGILSEDGLYNLLNDAHEYVADLSEYALELFADTAALKGNEIQLVLEKVSPGNPEKKRVPAYHFAICTLDGTKMGVCDLRIGHNEQLYYGGNIGYRIEEEYRGNHYAGKACPLLFDLARKHGLKYLIITCKPDNIPSRKTCEYAGGNLLGIASLPPHNDMRARGETEECIYKFKL